MRFLDGRDTPPKSAVGYLEAVPGGHRRARRHRGSPPSAGAITRWTATSAGTGSRKPIGADRAARASSADDPVKAVEAAYARGETDEFVLPTAIGDYARHAGRRRRAVRQFPRRPHPRDRRRAARSGFLRLRARRSASHSPRRSGLVEYSTELNRFLATLFPPDDLSDTFGEVVSDAGLTQLRIAETEKYAHVTFFFNGGRETVFPGEERILVPSPKVATYDLQPEMSAPEVTDKVVEAIRLRPLRRRRAELRQYRHGRPYRAASTPRSRRSRPSMPVSAGSPRRSRQAGGTLVITADHGNAEMMRDPETGEPHTAHTLNPVPFIVVNPPARDRPHRATAGSPMSRRPCSTFSACRSRRR